jgi:pilus assembly protein Flp/PilA
MKTVKSLLVQLVKGEEGVTMIEYALLAALIALAAIVTITNVGTAVNSKFSTIQTKLQ